MTKILNETHERSVFFSPVRKREDTFPIKIPSGEEFYTGRLTILSSWPYSTAKILSQPTPGQTGNAEIIVKWQCPRNSMVKYQIEAFSQSISPSADNTQPGTCQMTRFLPSKHGFHFDNRFDPTPTYLNTLFGPIKIGDASKGLCGGMVFSALDYFNAGMPIPTEENLPKNRELFDYVVKRLIQSFDLPFGPMNYIELMHPKYPDGKISRGRYGVIPTGRAWRMMRVEWPKIKMKLDAGIPCPLGLVRIKSTNLKRLGENHQVLAYGYELINDELTLYIYDPNYHGNDKVTLSLYIGDPDHPTKVRYWRSEKVNCFFMGDYGFSMPPGGETLPGRILLFENKNFDGKSINVDKGTPDLSMYEEGNFDECTSSFAILSGNWCFYRNPRFKNPFMRGRKPLVLGPGSYNWVEDLGIKDDDLSSLKAVNAPVNYH
jgi:hypothetical protein